MTDTPDYVTGTSVGKVGELPHVAVPGLEDRSLAPEILRLAGQFLENFLENVVKAFLGQFPGGDTAFNILSHFGETLNDLVTGFTNAFNQIGDIVQGLVVTPINDAISHFKDWWNASTASAQDAINGIVTGITGLGGNFVSGDIVTYVTGQSATVAQTSSAVALLQQAGSAGAQNGTSVFDDLSDEADSSTLPTDYTVTYSSPGPGSGSGTWTTAGGALVWSPGSGNYDATALYNATGTMSDYQLISAVFASTPGKRINFVGTTYFTRNVLRGRVNSTDDTCIEVRFGAQGFLLGYYSSGTWTQWTAKTHDFQPGSIYSLQCGTAGGTRIYRVLCNGAVLLSYTEVGTSSSIGTSFRGAGLGVRVNGHDSDTGSNTTQLQPGKVAAFAFADNTPVSIPGVAARYYRSSTSGVSHGTSGKWENDFLDTPDYQSNAFTPTLGTNCRIAVNSAGLYAVKMRVLTTSSQAAYMVLYVNGNPVDNGAHFGSLSFADTFLVRLAANDYIEPGYVQGASRSWVGDTTGAESYLEIMKIG